MIYTYEDILRAQALAYKLFDGKVYGDSSYYVGHIYPVVVRVGPDVLGDEPWIATVVAYLHDVLEDTDYTYEQMCRDFGQEVADIVLCLTRKEDETYKDYIKRVKQNKIATVVKRADAQVNLEQCLKDEDYERAKRYLDALIVLSE